MNNWSFGIDNDDLIKLVLEGKKTATTSLYETDKLPTIGEESIIHFDNEKDACVVKTKSYKVMKFGEMTADLAKLEGEGDLSLDYWKKTHYDYFKSLVPTFNNDSKIIFEEFELIQNLVEERLKLGKKIAELNLNLFKKIESIQEINSGFNNTLFNVNDKYVIKVCTKPSLEDTFKIEYKFYESNKDCSFIPKLYKYDDTKNDISYIYEIMEKLDGQTLYYYWYQMSEDEKKLTIKKLIDIIKIFHQVKTDSYDWISKIKNDIKKHIEECKDLFLLDDYNMIMDSINKYDTYLKDNIFALIHNDLHFDNIIFNNNELKIIDFNDSISAPIDFEFRQLYMCQEKPWKWADINMDPYQKPIDYQNIWKYIKECYPILNDINYLEQRMMIYKIWDSSNHLKKYKLQEQIDDIVSNSRKL